MLRLELSTTGSPTVVAASLNPRQVNGENFFVPGPRVNPNWVGINLIDTNGKSWYDSLQVVLSKRFSRGYQFQVSYTYGDCVDNAPPLLRDVESAPNIFGGPAP